MQCFEYSGILLMERDDYEFLLKKLLRDFSGSPAVKTVLPTPGV